MNDSTFAQLGEQLRWQRRQRNWSQPALAQRLGRNQARISELERDLLRSRWGRDRLTLFAEMCDALDVVPILVPRAKVADVQNFLADRGAPMAAPAPRKSAFDELFVDLDDEAGD